MLIIMITVIIMIVVVPGAGNRLGDKHTFYCYISWTHIMLFNLFVLVCLLFECIVIIWRRRPTDCRRRASGAKRAEQTITHINKGAHLLFFICLFFCWSKSRVAKCRGL